MIRKLVFIVCVLFCSVATGQTPQKAKTVTPVPASPAGWYYLSGLGQISAGWYYLIPAPPVGQVPQVPPQVPMVPVQFRSAWVQPAGLPVQPLQPVQPVVPVQPKPIQSHLDSHLESFYNE